MQAKSRKIFTESRGEEAGRANEDKGDLPFNYPKVFLQLMLAPPKGLKCEVHDFGLIGSKRLSTPNCLRRAEGKRPVGCSRSSLAVRGGGKRDWADVTLA